MQLMEYLPLYFQNIREYEAMMSAEQPEVNAITLATNTLQANEFIESLDAYGCSRWESMIGITPPAAATLEDRRFAISSKYKESLPYTWQALIARLDSTLGAGNYTIEEQRTDYKLVLRIMLVRKYQINEVKELMENLVPCNIILDISLMFNQYSPLEELTHQEISAYTHAELREEIME